MMVRADDASSETDPPAPASITARSLTPRRFVVVFAVLQLVLASFFLDRMISPNPTSRVLPVLTLVDDGTLQIDKYQALTGDKAVVDGHYYSDKPPLPMFAVLPFYALARVTGLAEASTPDHVHTEPVELLGDTLCGSVPFVVLVLLTYAACAKLVSRSEAAFIASLSFFGTFLFAYAGTYFGHVMAAALLLTAYVTLEDRPVLAGGALGAAVLCEYTLGLVGFFWIAQLAIFAPRARALRFIAGLAPVAVVGALYNHVVTGSFFETPTAAHADPEFAAVHHHYGFGLPSLDAVWGLSLSPFRGAVFYAPVLLAMAFAAYAHHRASFSWRALATSRLAAAAIPMFVALSGFFTWWGGWCFGPRYLVSTTALLLYEGALAVAARQNTRRAFVALAAVGLAFVFLDKATVVYMLPTRFSFPLVDVIVPELLLGTFNRDNLLTMLTGAPPLAGAVLWLVMFVACAWWAKRASV
jgi:hypothetical protein